MQNISKVTLINMNDSGFFQSSLYHFCNSLMQICVSTLPPACKILKCFDFLPSTLLATGNDHLISGILPLTVLCCVSSTEITIFSDDISTIEHWTRLDIYFMRNRCKILSISNTAPRYNNSYQGYSTHRKLSL